MLVTLYAHAQIDSVFAFAVCTVPHVVSFASPAREKLSINDMITTFTVSPASAWGATAKFWFCFAYDPVSTYSRLANQVSEVRVSFVADSWTFRELVSRGGIYLKVVPCGADDLVQIGKSSVVRNY